MITRALSVTEVNHFIKTMLDGNSVLKNLMVEGEISNLKFHSSGHVYFSLKDSQSRIACVMFRNHVQNLKFRPAEGMKITIKGGISVFERNGQYQIYVRSMEPQGVGALYKAFEQLKDEAFVAACLPALSGQPAKQVIKRVFFQYFEENALDLAQRYLGTELGRGSLSVFYEGAMIRVAG